MYKLEKNEINNHMYPKEFNNKKPMSDIVSYFFT